MVGTAAFRTRGASRIGVLTILGVACAAALVPAVAGGAAVSTKTTTFSGHIVSGTGRNAKLRATVRLVLRSSGGVQRPGGKPTTYAFTLTLSCTGTCTKLHGTVTGSAFGVLKIPDGGTAFTLSGHGNVAPLGPVNVSGTSHTIGFIRTGRYPLSLRLRNASGTVTITALGPVAQGFTSPF